jgi:hypothetical protein
MFSVPRGSSDPDERSRDGKPVLSLPESARVLYDLLWLAYPRHPYAWGRPHRPKAVNNTDIDGIANVHATAKYQFLLAERLAKEMLEGPVHLNADPTQTVSDCSVTCPPSAGAQGRTTHIKISRFAHPLSFAEMENLM